MFFYYGYGIYESYVVGGTSYKSEWKNGVFYGHSNLTFAYSSKKVGEFKGGNIHGIGKTICPECYFSEADFGEATKIDSCSGCGHEHQSRIPGGYIPACLFLCLIQ